MLYIVYYKDDDNKQHMTFVKTYKDVEFLKDRFGAITVESYKMR